jgi:hypothetical protein
MEVFMKKMLSVFAVTFSGLMIAISIVVKLMTQYIPLSGLMIFRLDFYGPFEKMPGLLFGPLMGGIAGALVDFLGYLFADKSANAFIPPLTVTAFLNCFMVGLLWKAFQEVKLKTLSKIYVLISWFVFAFGAINRLMVLWEPKNSYYGLLSGVGKNIVLFTYGPMLIGIIGITIYWMIKLINNHFNNPFFQEKYFKVFVTLIIPGLIITTINTEILRLFIPALADKNIYIFLVPRLVGQVFETLYDSFMVCMLLVVSRPLLRNKHQRIYIKSEVKIKKEEETNYE